MVLTSFDVTNTEAGVRLLEELTTNARQVQQQVLTEILTENANTEYLRHFLQEEYNGMVDNFKKKVPVVSYEDVRPYIQRIADGEPSQIISTQPITELLTSSGTSGGQPKLMPSTAQELDRKTFFYNILAPVMNTYVEGLDQGKAMYLLFIKPEITTPAGLVARPVLTSYYKSNHFRNRPFNPFTVYTSPDETILCSDSRQSMYCQLLCGLMQQDQVLRVGAIFASAFLRAIKFLNDYWQELCHNIRTGVVSEWISDPSCRDAVYSILGEPRPNLADLIEQECSAKSWQGIIKKLWPRTKFIEVIVTGTMAQYIPTLEFYGGGLPLISTMYASSECYFGINLKPLSKPRDVSYTLLPNMAYFEFIPVHKDGETLAKQRLNFINGRISDANVNDIKEDIWIKSEIVDLVDVKIGLYYELVVTTYTGLYRYRVGDILMVTGFHNSAPEFRFVERRNVVLSIDTDKTSEEDLLKAITEAKMIIEPLGFLVTEYTSYADTTSIPGHYVLYWEIRRVVNGKEEDVQENRELLENVLDPIIMEQCCSRVEECLDSVYRRCRKKDQSIGALEIRVVKQGTFDALMDFCVSQGSSVNQYKTPRCINGIVSIEVLESRVVAKFFSKNVPSWEQTTPFHQMSS